MKTVLAGAVIAAATGLLVGAIARPELNVGDDTGGPQAMAARAAPPPSLLLDNPPAFAAYGHQIPDYVLGTDLRTSLTRAAAQADGPRLARNDQPPPAEELHYTQTTYGEPTPQAGPPPRGDTSPDEAEADEPTS